MYKLSHEVAGSWVEHSYPPLFGVEQTMGGGERLRIGVPAGDCVVLKTLSVCLPEPLIVLYVLHTSRGEAEEGRYQSPELAHREFGQFLKRFEAFFSGDSRHDLWVFAPASKATLVWDRHNLMFAYGPLDVFRSALRSLGFSEGRVDISFPHTHYYRPEFDNDAANVIAAFDWKFSPLRPEDEQ